MKIAIGSDHAGYALKQLIVEHLEQQGYSVNDIGTHSTESTDYPQYGRAAAEEIVSGRADRGILICGTGVGISIAANKVAGIRAVVCSDPLTAELSVRHNNTNILALGARIVGDELAKYLVDHWLQAKFEGGRHLRRVREIEPEHGK
ncbi:MAG: Ribose/Galactose Isomerase [Candidatus Tokpelaia hoelldobleri]|uniref:Ribose/Galactose Isomerase n=1 Tax=Candidatus Tokpelaia hoelldobleri TaxID=1902579 RepID=A0A1U9JU09_9HYPH|nr:MAG: Ribose/Galactose Isomerase [Candidatus Tokpelaia hoelldoblerii]